MKIKHLAVIPALAVGLLASQSASAITIGTYNLSNHPDGSAQPPQYGFRLDGLLGHSKYTFDFDHASSNMTLSWDGAKIVIDGQAFGGADVGATYGAGTTAVWDIHFEYTIGISQPGDTGLDDLYVNADNANFGTLSSSFGDFELEDQADGSGQSFQFGDESDGSGHRGHSGISGWGWVNHGTDCITGNCSHITASDWLFTASPVPVPAAVWLFGSGLMMLTGFARRRRR